MNGWTRADFIKFKCFRRQRPKIEVIGGMIRFLGNKQLMDGGTTDKGNILINFLSFKYMLQKKRSQSKSAKRL